MKSKHILLLILCLVAPLSIGGLSGYISASGLTDWYLHLNKPTFNPPGYVFGPVWTALYILMGISLFMILKAPESSDRSKSIVLFWVQITLNFMWSILFFKYHLLGIALIEILLIWLAICFMIYRFKRVSPWAAWLQLPYLLWVTFASLLTFSIWILN